MVNVAETERIVGLRNAAIMHTAADSALLASELASLKRDQIVRQLLGGYGYVVRVRVKTRRSTSIPHCRKEPI